MDLSGTKHNLFCRFQEDADCEDYLKVCCQNVIPPVTIDPASGDQIKEPHIFNDCGTRNMDGAGFRITHATQGETEFGEFPWMVALFAGDSYVCGGSLIRPNVVVTAGHCVFSRQNERLVVRAGEWDSKTTDEVLAFQVRWVVLNREKKSNFKRETSSISGTKSIPSYHPRELSPKVSFQRHCPPYS